MLGPWDKVDEEDWDSNRDERWAEIEDEVDMDRGTWEHEQNVNDYGLTREVMDSGDDEDF